MIRNIPPPLYCQETVWLTWVLVWNFKSSKSFGDYSIVLLNNLGDVGAVDKKGNEAGYYSGNSLIVHEEHRGKGLAIALVLYAYEHREEIPQSRSLTDGGRNALKAAWEVANSQRSSAWWP